MTQTDDKILEVLHSSELILSPVIIAINIDRSRKEVSERISILTEYGLVEKVERGKYRISDDGRKYVEGELDASTLEKDE